MHRSITLSEIASSTFSNRIGKKEEETKKRELLAKIGIGFIEFLACSLHQCFGILLAEFVRIGEFSLKKSTWTILIFLSSWHIIAPYSQFLIKFLEERNQIRYKLVIACSSLLLSIGINLNPHYIWYGIFGGIFSNIMYSNLKRIARRFYKSTEKTFEGNIMAARAISLLIMPHIVLALVANFTLDRALMIYSAVILNIIPAVLIIKLPELDDDHFPGLNRYQTLPAFSQQIKEMKVFSASDIHLDSKNEDNDDNDEIEDDDDLLVREIDPIINNSPLPTPLTLNTVQLYYSQAGVSILPEIPEEEELEDDKNINNITSKRLSRISNILEDINSKERDKKDNAIKEIVIPKEILIKPEAIQEIEFIQNYTEKRTFMKDFKFKRKKCCSPYSIFVWKRRMRSWKDLVVDYIFIPLTRSLTDLHFYPSLFSKLSLSYGSVFYLSLVPYVVLQKNEGYKNEDMAFFLSYSAFSWCLSLILMPLLITFSAAKLRVAFIGGLVLSSCSMLLLTKRKMSNDFIIWSSLLFGFGHGIAKFAENFVYKSFSGKRRFLQFEQTLNVFTGISVILVYYFVYTYDVDLVDWFPIVSLVAYSLNALLWTSIPFVKDVIVYLSKYFRRDFV